MAIRELIDFDDEPAQRALDALERALDAHADKLGKSFKGATEDSKRARKAIADVGEETKGLGRIIDVSIGNIAAAAFQNFIGILKRAPGYVVDLAKRTASLVEIQSKYLTVFGTSVGVTSDYVQSQSALLGLTKSQAKELLATTGAILQGAGLTRQASAEMSVSVARLAGDLASFNDAPIEETFGALQAALTGERERLKQYGIVLNEAEVQQRALAESGKSTASSLTQQEKAVASLALIYEKAGVAVGDLERTQDSAANQIRKTESNIAQLKDEFFNGLIPAVGRIAEEFAELSGDENIEELAREIGEQLGGALERVFNIIAENKDDVLEFFDELGEDTLVIIETVDLLSQLSENVEAFVSQTGELEGFIETLGKLSTVNLLNPIRQLEFLNDALRFVLGNGGNADDPSGSPGLSKVDRRKAKELFDERFANKSSDADAGDDDDDDDGKPTITPAEVKAIQSALDGLQKITEARRLASQFTKDQRAALAEVINIQERITKLKEIEKATGSQAARDELEFAEAALITARAKLEVAGAFAQNIQDAAAAFNGLAPRGTQGVLDFIKAPKPKSVLDDIKDGVIQSSALRELNVSPQEIARIVKLLDDAAKQSDKWAEGMKSVGTSIRSIVQFADVFGDLNEDVRNIGLGIADVLDNAGGLQDLIAQGKTGLALAPGVIGVAAGVASVIGGVVSALSDNTKAEREAAEARQRETDKLVAALSESARAFEKFASGQLNADIVGDSLSRSDLAQAQELYVQLTRSGNNPQAIRDIVAELIDLGVADQSFSDIFEEWLANGATSATALAEALKATGLAEFLEDLTERFAEFGDTLSGVLKEIQINADFGGLDLTGQLALFLERIGESEVELGSDLERILQEQLGNIDLTTQEGQDALREFIRTLSDAFTNQGRIGDGEYPNPFTGSIFGDLFAEISPDQFEELLNFLQGLVGGGGGIDGGESNSAVYNRSITEVQANEISAYLEQIAFATLGMYRLMGGEGEPGGDQTPNGGVFAGGGPSYGFPDPPRPEAGSLSPGQLAARYIASGSSSYGTPGDGATGAIGGRPQVNIGSIEVPTGMSRAEKEAFIREVCDEVARKLDRDIDGFQNRSF